MSKGRAGPAARNGECGPRTGARDMAIVGHDGEKLHNFEVTPDKFKRWEDCPETVAKVEHYAQMLAKFPGADA